MDLNKLSRGEMIAGGAGVVLLILSFLPLWSKYETPLGTTRTGLWSAVFPFYIKLALLLVLVGVVLVGIRAAGTATQLPISYGLAYVGAFGVATLLLLLGLIAGPAFSGVDVPGFEGSRGILLFVGFLVSGAAAIGGYMHMQEEGSAPTTGPAVPPPPPA